MNKTKKTFNNEWQLPLIVDRTPEIIDSELLAKLKLLPKVDLHRHLTGSIRTKTIIDLSKENKVDLPTDNPDELEKNITCLQPIKNFSSFINLWGDKENFNLNSVIQKERDFFRLTYEAIEDAHKDNVKYLELRTSPYGITRGNGNIFRFPEVLKYINEAIEDAHKDFGVITKLILGIPRAQIGWKIQCGKSEFLKYTYFKRLLEISQQYKNIPVVGFDLSGQHERKYPPKLFGSFFTDAKERGFKISIHAGETGDTDSILDAINILHADRIGHGIHADEETQNILKEKSIPLEICPTSNIRTGVVDSWLKCRIKELYDNGMTITINTDNPRVFKTTLTDEYLSLIINQNFKFEEIKKIILNGVAAAFITDKEKSELKFLFNQEFEKNS